MVEIVGSRFKPKGIYFIHDPQIAKGVAHFRICVSNLNGEISLACCTTNEEYQRHRAKLTSQHADTLVMIDHTSRDNDLVSVTIVNCDTVHHYTEEELRRLEPPKILNKGCISDEEYEKILKGYLLSDQVSTYFQAECNDILNPD